MPHFPAEAFGLETGGSLARSKAPAPGDKGREMRGAGEKRPGQEMIPENLIISVDLTNTFHAFGPDVTSIWGVKVYFFCCVKHDSLETHAV